jgi:uncharacterized membrane protein
MAPPTPPLSPADLQAHPFRRAVIRGLGVLLPPLLTIVIFLWVGNTVVVYLLEPVESLAKWGIFTNRYQGAVLPAEEAQTIVGAGRGTLDGDILRITNTGREYRRTSDEKFVPRDVYRTVRDALNVDPMPASARGVYMRYIEIKHLQRVYIIPLFLAVFIMALYLLGKFLAAGMGKFFWGQFERAIHRLPVIRNVYSSVKQVTDFLFSERDVEYTRVVAVEYPRKGIWSLGMVTGESMLDIRGAANEPVLSLLIPTSPAPFTGFTVTVRKSETVDLNLTIDQAFQFIVSCGVVVPPDQLSSLAERKAVDAIDGVGRSQPALVQHASTEE